jgi:chorismate mutase
VKKDNKKPLEKERLHSEMKRLQLEIEKKDKEIALLLNDRAELVLEIGELKEALGMPVYNFERERAVVDHIKQYASRQEFELHLQRIYERILDESRAIQLKRYKERKSGK